MQKFVEIAGVATRISDTGNVNLCPVLLLHGFLENLDVWEDFGDELTRKGLRVIALDLPGHGISQTVGEVHSMAFLADIAAGVLDKVGIEKATVVGHSMGGYVALELLRRHPEHVSGLVLFHSHPNADPPERAVDRERTIEIIRSGRKELLMGDSAKGFAPENLRRCAAEIKELAEQLYISEDDGIVALLRGMASREDLNEMLSQSAVSQLFILGRHDAFIPQKMAEELIVTHPGAKVLWLEHSGHNGFIEQPEECINAIVTFIGQTPR